MKNLHFFLLGIAFTALLAAVMLFFIYTSLPDTKKSSLHDLKDLIYEHSPRDSLKQAAIYDKGLQMLRGAYFIPQDWLLQQDIYTGFYDGSMNRLLLNFKGAEGELIRVKQQAGSYKIGKAADYRKFEPEIKKIYQQGLKGILDEYQLGISASGKPSGISYLDTYVRTDSLCQYLETSVSGSRDGKAYEGIIRIVYLSHAGDRSDAVFTYLTLSPEGRLQQTLQTEEQIAYSYQANPAFEQYMLKVTQQHRDYLDNLSYKKYMHIPEWKPGKEKMSGWEYIP